MTKQGFLFLWFRANFPRFKNLTGKSLINSSTTNTHATIMADEPADDKKKAVGSLFKKKTKGKKVNKLNTAAIPSSTEHM